MSTSFGQTLQYITAIKLQELEKQRRAYRTLTNVVEDAKSAPNLIARVEMLLKAVRSWSGSGSVPENAIINSKVSMGNIDYWLLQAKVDPSFSDETLKEWVENLERHISQLSTRFDCAKLFGSLFNEWLASGDSSTNTDTIAPSDQSTNTSYEVVGTTTKHLEAHRNRISSVIFTEAQTNEASLMAYFEELFSPEGNSSALWSLRYSLGQFGEGFPKRTITVPNVLDAINGLLASSLMDDEKRATLKELQESPADTVLAEVASVLNMRMAAFESWSWPEKGLTITMRRHLNGKYRAFTEPEVIDAIFLQYIGIAWQVQLKTALKAFVTGYNSPWNMGPDSKLPTSEISLRTQQLSGEDGERSLRRQRLTGRESHFFMSRLSSEPDKPSSYDDLLDAPSHTTTTTTDDQSPAAVKKHLLNILTADCLINKGIHGRHCIIQSDLELFGPSLPHQSILTILKFFGIPDRWLTFFKTFLRAPLRFEGDPPTQLRVRERGTPISYALSVVCGEAVLFGMDFAVNQRANGMFLHRMHDDLWLWDADPKLCLAAWREMKTYADLVGMKFNQGNTGSATVGGERLEGLPVGEVTWGFLTFDEDQARFVIDQKEVSKQVAEMRRQLAGTRSVFGWVNVYNKYIALFLRNFGGQLATCQGKVHLDETIATMAQIQRDLFDGTDGGVVGYLRGIIQERFGISDLPVGYFYIPIGNGGLELRNPMVDLFAYQYLDPVDTDIDPIVLVRNQINSDEIEYKWEKKSWDERRSSPAKRNDKAEIAWGELPPRHWSASEGENVAAGVQPFISWEKYLSIRETWLKGWGQCYESLLEPRSPVSLPLPSSLEAARLSTNCSDTWYDQWIAALYGHELLDRYGGLNVVDPTLIPVGMVQLFRTSRMRLQD